MTTYRELKKGDVIAVDRQGDVRIGDDVCRVVRPLRKVDGEFVIYVIPACEPEEDDEAAWENEDVEELVVSPGESVLFVPKEDEVCALRDFVVRLVSGSSPVSESELEEVCRKALAGGYRLDVDAFSRNETAWRNRPE